MAWKETGAATMLIGLAATGAHAQQDTSLAMRHGYWDGPWHGWFMGPIMLVFLAIVVIFFVRWSGTPDSSRKTSHQSSSRDPLDILRERFARGEIDKAEFEERRKALED